jgi:hypothetical protein
MVTVAAFWAVHVKVELWPLAMLGGSAVMVAASWEPVATVTVAEAVAVPPTPVTVAV